MMENPTAESEIRAIIADWLKAVANKNIEAITNIYSNEGSILAAGAAPMHGHAAIRTFWDGLLRASDGTLTFGPTSIRIAVSGTMACELGKYSFTTKAEGSEILNSGKYVVVWTSQNNAWKVLVDSLVSD